MELLDETDNQPLKEFSMKTISTVLVFILLWTATGILAFDTPDVVYIRATIDRTNELAKELCLRYSVTGGGEDYVDLIVPRSELDDLAKQLPSFEVIYNSEQERIDQTVGADYEDYFHDYTEMVQILNQAEVDHPSIVKVQHLGFSVENRYIMGAKISDNPLTEEDEPEFRVIGLHHGNELMGTEMNLNLLEYLTDNYGVDSTITNLIDNTEIWIIPMMNPDGRMATPYPTRYNANGVDLNRDYGYMWNYVTPGRFSQPETRSIRNNGLDNAFMLSLSYHTSGDIVNYVWNYSSVPTQDDEIISLLSEEYGSYNGYWVVDGYYWYQTYGDCNDWSYGSRSSIDWTIEVADNNIDQVWNLNRDAMITLLQHTDEGIRGIITDADTGEPLEATVTVQEIGYPWYNDPAVGDYHRMLLPGTYTVTYSSPGHVDTTISGITVSDTGATKIDVALRPGGNNYAYQVVSCYFYDADSWPNQYQKNPTNANYALGYPDTVSASLGEGGDVVLDFGQTRLIPNIDGDDFTVYEEDPPDGYNVYASNNFTGPWTYIGAGTGTSSFDIGMGGFNTARYVKIVDDDDGDPYAWYPGCDIDAVVSIPLPDTLIISYESHVMTDTTYGNGNGRIDPGETVELWVSLTNVGNTEATGVTALLSSEDSLITVDIDTASYPDMPGGEGRTSLTPYVITASANFPEGEWAVFDLSISADGGYMFDGSFNELVGMKPILLVDDDDGDNHQQFFTYALDEAGYPYDTWEVISQGAPVYDDIANYRILIWTTGDEYEGTLTSADKTNISQYLDAGGNLFISSQDYLYEHGTDAFATDYLHVDWFSNDVGVSAITGVNGDPISDGLSYTLTYPSGFSNWSDDILPDAEATGVFTNSGYTEKAVGAVDYYGCIRYPASGNATFKTVFFAVPFEAFPLGGGSTTVMERTIEWFNEAPVAATLELDPDTTSIGAGGVLGMQVTVANQLSSEEDFVFWTNVTLPGGGTFPPSGYLLGPVPATLDSMQTVSVHLSHDIPGPTPRLTYTYNAYLSRAGDVIAEDHFDFTVTNK